ncbi:acylphosphatase [Sphingobacterium humi]|uniref:acylphosphatase n=1 Tax=Sphingobacterium humi TaxID=1796905 RepID=A0A6N8L5J2_9SPHI|nr:acylphosphatase [Sphingobacterium humi]MVZ63022.1 acylphosphatase [Sphingobacterium humi]
MKHWNIKVKGKVQGVFFRASTKAVADQLGVKGFVLNEADGTVYIEAEGDAIALDFLLDFCKEGPYDAEVSDVQVEESTDLKNFKNFEVIKKRN